jgi:G6PDH family F420-dependent oxidoreductase
MAKHGLTLSSEEHPPARLVEIAVAAEAAGFDFVSISDHFHPWLGVQGHSPFVWSVLGAIAHATDEIEVGVGVTCPTFRMHPAIVAHATATAACMLPGRFTFGVGSGEALNEHIVGGRWPPADLRLAMLGEAIEVIRALWSGESVNHRGRHYTVEDARLFDLPSESPPLLVSAFGQEAARFGAEAGDGLWTSGAARDVIQAYRGAGGDGPIWGQISVCWDRDEEQAVDRALRIWPNTVLPGQLAQDLPTVLHFEQAVSMVDRSDVAEAMHCGPEAGPIVGSITRAVDLGIDYVYLHQVGDPLEGFIDFWRDEIRPRI